MPPGPPAWGDETLDATAHQTHTTRADVGATGRLISAYPRDLDVILDLGAERSVLGRQPPELQTPPIPHPKVSRGHFAVEWSVNLGRHVGQDLGSRNGAWVNGVRCRRGWRTLEPGSVVRVGDVLLVYEKHRTFASLDNKGVRREAMLGRSSAVRALRDLMSRAAPDISPALILGETGTGKEQIARELHHLSERPGRFVAVNCATLSEQLIESQLFGHKKGAFTGATQDQDGLFVAAEDGTLFLDEIGELPLELQPKLLRALQEREVRPLGSTETVDVDARVVAATHRDLARRVASGHFRQDLYARLSLWTLEVPPLRSRRADVLLWLDRLYDVWRSERGLAPARLDLAPDAAEALLLARWPENLRGLNRLVHELASEMHAGPIRRHALPAWLREEAST